MDKIMNANEVVKDAEKKIIENGYTPFALWYSHEEQYFIITTQDVDYSSQMTLIKKYKK